MLLFLSVAPIEEGNKYIFLSERSPLEVYAFILMLSLLGKNSADNNMEHFNCIIHCCSLLYFNLPQKNGSSLNPEGPLRHTCVRSPFPLS